MHEAIASCRSLVSFSHIGNDVSAKTRHLHRTDVKLNIKLVLFFDEITVKGIHSYVFTNIFIDCEFLKYLTKIGKTRLNASDMKYVVFRFVAGLF